MGRQQRPLLELSSVASLVGGARRSVGVTGSDSGKWEKWECICSYNGVGEIRTHEGVSPLAVFKTAALNHSATTPRAACDQDIGLGRWGGSRRG